MKLLVNGLLIVALLLANKASSQNLKVAKSRLLDYKSLNYLGSNSIYNFFSTEKEDKSYLVKVDVNDINKIEEERIKLREPEIARIFISDSNLFYITYTGKPAKFIYTAGGVQRTESTVTAINFYKYDSYTGILLAREQIDLEEEDIKNGVSISVDLEKRYIGLTSTDYYDFDFDYIEDIKLYNKTLGSGEKAFQIRINRDHFNLKPYFKDWKKEAASKPQEISTRLYNIQYNENTDNSVAALKTRITDVKILGNSGKGIKQKFQLPDDKTIIDLYATVTPDNSLILLGKYCEKKDDKVIYGFFTAKYDDNLKITRDIVYTTVIETDKKQKDLDKHTFGYFFFTPSSGGFNYDLIGNRSQFFFYQFCDTKIRGIVNYEVIAEDIYAIMIDSLGIVKMKKNPLYQNSRLLGYCRPMLIGYESDFYLIYYDNKANIEPSGKRLAECNFTVANTVLVSQKIDVEKVDVDTKKVILNCNDSKFIPETTMMKAANDGAFKGKMVYLSYSNGFLYQFTFE